MFYFISELILFISLGVMIFVLARKLPVIQENSLETTPSSSKEKKSFFHFRWVEILDKKFAFFLAVVLRRFKLMVMKLDNFISRHLERIKEKGNGQENQEHVIKEIHSSSENSDQEPPE